MKKILALTGIRSEFDIIAPVLTALQNNGFEIGVVVSGAHLSDWHGDTLSAIARSFRIVDRIDSLFMTDRKTQRVKGVGVLLYGLAQTVEREAPDFLMVVGDREESIAAALVGNYMDVLVAHLAGGDPLYGNDDDPVRHAVSKLAHIHFTFTAEHSRVLKTTGEEEFRIFTVGNPALDRIRTEPETGLAELEKRLGVNLANGNFVVLIQHPVSAEREEAYRQMRVTLEALEELGTEKGLKTVGIYPNTDPGSLSILEAIKTAGSSQYINFFKTLERNTFINLLRQARALVGNSSMGILEAPFYKLPVVQVGDRQKARINCGNVRFVPHQKEDIKREVLKACYDEEYRGMVAKLENIYGDGYTSERISRILKEIDPRDPRWLRKRIVWPGGTE